MKSIVCSRICLIFLGLTAICVAVPLVRSQLHSTRSARPPSSVPAPPPSSYGQVPLSFEANHGQANEPVKFLARGTNATLYLTPTEAALEVKGLRNADFGMRNEQSDHQPPTTDHQPLATAIVKMKLLGANANPRLQGEQELPGKSNYFSGSDPNGWQTNIPTYRQVKYEQVYDGIDLVYYGNQQQLEYDFIVQPGADPQAIKFRLEGREAIALNAAGELVLQTAVGEVKQHKPVLYQEVNGSRQEIAGSYVLKDGEVGFEIGDYDPSQPLVIDPVIIYATYLGGDLGGAVALTADKEGQAYVAMNYGPTATAGAYQSGTGFSVFKLNKAGTGILYSVTMGGSPFDRVYAMTVDAQGNCYLTGQAVSSIFPTTPSAFQTDIGVVCGACHNAFVAKINVTGSSLEYATFLKGDDTTATKSIRGHGIAVDVQGNAYVTGYTNAKDFPVTPGAFQTQLNNDFPTTPARDSFVTKLNPTGTALVYSTYLGGGDNADQGKNIAVDTQGNAYVIGLTANGYNGPTVQKTPFPITPGAYQSSQDVRYGGVYLAKFNPTGSALVYSTIIGQGPGSADNIGLVLDANGNVHIAASTQSADYPVTPSAFQTTLTATPRGSFNAFITKVNAAGSELIYSTFIGGNYTDGCIGIGLDPDGNAIIVGTTSSSNFPQTNPEGTYSRGGYITKLNATGSKLLFSQVNNWVSPRHMAVDAKGDVYLEGGDWEEGPFQPTPGAYQTTKPYSTTLSKFSLPKSAVTVSATNYSGSPLASEAIVSAFGTGLAITTQGANSIPLPTTLGGTKVKVRDSVGIEREAALFFVSPTQVNFQIPPNTANGNATITITAQDGAIFLSQVEIANVVPGLFSADTTGRGFAAAHAQRGGSLAFEQVVKFDSTKAQFVALPIDLGPATDQVYLILYGTGIRLRSNLNNVTATIGAIPATVSYAGAQPGFVGLDQVNILIPRSLIGRGLVDVILNVEGKAANTVKVSVK